MENDEYIRMFLKKHNFDGNITVNTLYGMTWDDVVSIICNEKDIPSKNEIDIDDIIYDVVSDMPEDAFKQWISHCNNGGKMTYREWCTTDVFNYIPSGIDFKKIYETEKIVEDKLNEVFDKFNEKYKDIINIKNADIVDSDYDESDSE